MPDFLNLGSNVDPPARLASVEPNLADLAAKVAELEARIEYLVVFARNDVKIG
jgi:hypothetical protein